MRSALIAPILAALSLLAAIGAPAAAAADAPEREARITIAILPGGTDLEELASVEGLAPGLLNAGIGGGVPAAQTYLDISQGTRVFNHFYDTDLPPILLTDDGVREGVWERVVERAESAPARVVPGLLTGVLEREGVQVRAAPRIGHAALIAADRDGRVERLSHAACEETGCGPGVSVVRAAVGDLAGFAEGLRGDDLLIAMRDAPPALRRQLPLALAGRGFEGTLRSASTRTDGFVLSTDIAPTILERLGVAVPAAMNGTPIRARGDFDIDSLRSLDSRLGERPERGAVIGIPMLAWLLLTGLAALVLGGRGARPAVALLALSGIYLPALLLVGAALRPSEPVEAVIVGLGSPLAAAATLLALRGYGALALACAVTVAAHAVDVVAGSPLTALSVLGPNPAGGVRFFGIGNELEATVAALVPLGVGAALATRPGVSRRQAALAFALAALIATGAFAPGRFGAAVGAAITLPVGAVVGAAIVLRLSRRAALALAAAVPAAAVAALVAIDLVSGGDAHLSRTVLGADGPGDLQEVVTRRLRLTLRSFVEPSYPLLLVVSLVLLGLGYARRRRISAWFGDRDAARAGFLAALAATLVGTVANDSGAILLIIGTIYVAIAAGFFWARGEASAAGDRDHRDPGDSG